MSVQRDELSALKFLDRLQGHLKHVREPQKAFRYTLRETHDFFDASYGCIARLQPGRPHAEILFSAPKGGRWNVDELDLVHRAPASPGPPGCVDGPPETARRRMGRTGLEPAAGHVQPRRPAPGDASGRDAVGRDLSHRQRPHGWRARSHRSKDHGADRSEGPLLPDPRRPPIAHPVRSLIGAADSEGKRSRPRPCRRADCVGQGEKPSDWPATSHCAGDRDAAHVGTGLRVRSRTASDGRNGVAGPPATLRHCSTTTPMAIPAKAAFAKPRCSARRWSLATA